MDDLASRCVVRQSVGGDVARERRKSAVWIAFRIAVRLVASERILQRKIKRETDKIINLKISATMAELNKVFDSLPEDDKPKSLQTSPKIFQGILVCSVRPKDWTSGRSGI